MAFGRDSRVISAKIDQNGFSLNGNLICVPLSLEDKHPED